MELGKKLEDQGVTVLTGNCLYRDVTDPYLPFVGAIETFLGDKEKTDSEKIGGISFSDETLKNIPLGLLPFDEREEEKPQESKESFWEVDHEKGRYMIFETMSQFIIEISKKNPTLLFIDDLQWADSASLHLLHYLARNTKKERVMICGAYRIEDLETREDEGVPLLETLRRMGRENLYETISLKSLTKDDTKEMLLSLFNVSDIPEDFINLMFKETKGNPFFLEEVSKSLLDEGVIKPEKDTWKTTVEISKISIPNTIRDIILRRIDRLNEMEREIIKHASIIGEHFTLKLLKNIIDIDEDTLIIGLDNLIRAKLVYEDFKGGEERYIFSHPMIHEVVTQEMSKGQMQLIHRKIGNLLEDLYLDNITAVVYDLAHHFYHGNEVEKSVYYAQEAGERALLAYAMDHAIEFFKMAFESLEKLDRNIANTRHYQEKEMEILTRLGEISGTVGEWDAGLDYYNKLIKLSKERDDDRRLAEAYRNIGLIQLRRGDWDNAASNLEDAYDVSRKIGDIRSMSKVHYNLGVLYERKGDYHIALRNYGETMSKSVDMGESGIIGKAYTGMGRVLAQQGKYHKAIEALKNAVTIFEKENDIDELAKTYQNMGATYYFTDLAKCLDSHNNAIKLAGKTGNIRIKAYALSNAAEVHIKNNQIDKATDYLKKAVEIFEKIDEKVGLSVALTSMASLYRIKKNWESCCEYLKRSIDICKEYDIPYHFGDAIFEYGLYYRDRGENKKAEEKFKEALKIFKTLNNEERVIKIEEELSKLLPPVKK